jgi:hypothetical protein
MDNNKNLNLQTRAQFVSIHFFILGCLAYLRLPEMRKNSKEYWVLIFDCSVTYMMLMIVYVY